MRVKKSVRGDEHLFKLCGNERSKGLRDKRVAFNERETKKRDIIKRMPRIHSNNIIYQILSRFYNIGISYCTLHRAKANLFCTPEQETDLNQI